MGGILVVAEHLRGEVRDITGEMIGAAVSIKDGIGGPLMVAVIGDASSVENTNLSLSTEKAVA